MNAHRHITKRLSIVSMAIIQTGCISMPNQIRISAPHHPSVQPDLSRLARCSRIDIAVAPSGETILYGDFTSPGVISGHTLKEDNVDEASLKRIRDAVGQRFADRLQSALPGTTVRYQSSGTSPSRAPGAPGEQRADESAVCVLNYTYVIHFPRQPKLATLSIGSGPLRTISCTMAVLEPQPPLIIPRVESDLASSRRLADRAIWMASPSTDVVPAPKGNTEHAIDCVAKVKVFGPANVLRPSAVQVDYAALERAMLSWANRRAAEITSELQQALGRNMHAR